MVKLLVQQTGLTERYNFLDNDLVSSIRCFHWLCQFNFAFILGMSLGINSM